MKKYLLILFLILNISILKVSGQNETYIITVNDPGNIDGKGGSTFGGGITFWKALDMLNKGDIPDGTNRVEIHFDFDYYCKHDPPFLNGLNPLADINILV